MTGRKPSRTASAPATGWRKPQARFWTDMARAKSETVSAMSRVSAGMTRPKLWRTPMPRLSITEAPIRMGMTGRNSFRMVMARLPLITQTCVP